MDISADYQILLYERCADASINCYISSNSVTSIAVQGTSFLFSLHNLYVILSWTEVFLGEY